MTVPTCISYVRFRCRTSRCIAHLIYSDDIHFVLARAPQKKHALRSTIQHWHVLLLDMHCCWSDLHSRQLRDLISCPSNKELVHVVGNNVAMYNTVSKQSLTLFKDLSFPPTCLATGSGYLAVGGERSQLMVRQLHSNWFSHSSVGGCINNALCIADHNFCNWPSQTNAQSISPSTSYNDIAPTPISSPPAVSQLSTRGIFSPLSITSAASPMVSTTGNNTRLYVCNNDETIKIYTLPGLQRITSISLPTAVNHVSVSPDGRKMLAVGDSNQVFLYDVTPSGGYHRVATYTAQGSVSSFSCAWNYASEKFAVASQDGFVYVWDVRSTEKLAKFVTKQYPHEKGAARNVKFSSSGSIDLLVFAEHTSYVHLVDARTFNQRQIVCAAMPNIDQHIAGLAFTPDSKSLFIGLENYVVEYDVNTMSRRSFPHGSVI